MSTLDYFILIPILFGAYQGYRKGLTTTFFKFLALILGVILGFKLIHVAARLLVPYFGDAKGFLPILSFIVVFITVVVGVNMMGKMIKKLLNLTLLGSFDSIAGAVLGGIKWAFITGTIFWLLEKGDVEMLKKESINSIIYPVVVSTSPKLIDFFAQLMPFASDIVDYIKELDLQL